MSPVISEPTEVTPTPEASVARNVIMGLTAWPLMMIVMSSLALPILALNAMNIVTAVAVAIVAELLAIFLALLVTDKTKKWKNALYLRNFRWKNVVLGFVTGVSLFILLQAVAIAISLSGEKLESSDTSTALGAVEGFAKYAVLLFIVPFIVPLVEELFFRGVIFGFIKNSGMQNSKHALILGTLASTLMFGAAHFQGFDSLTGVFVVFLTGGIGAVNCWLIYKTDSIYTAYACHMGYNLATSIVTIIAMSAH